MRQRAARLGLALIALGGGLLAQPTNAGAITVTKSAWWSRASEPASIAPPAAAVPGVTAPTLPATPPRPDVAEGSLLVEGTPAGATAIAAITYTLTDTETSPILTVTPSASSNVPTDAVILACLAALDWSKPDTQPGPWADKPLVECRRSVNGIIADGTITFPLEPLLSATSTELDIVLVPGNTPQTTPAGAVGSTFTLSFDAAEGAAITTATKATSPTPTTLASSVFSPPRSTGSPSFTAPIADPVVAPALEPQDQAPIEPDQQMAAVPAAAAEDNTAQGVAFLVLLAGATLAALAYLTPDRTEGGTIGLGRFKRPTPATVLAMEPVEGGLGRFARLRTAAPSRLS